MSCITTHLYISQRGRHRVLNTRVRIPATMRRTLMAAFPEEFGDAVKVRRWAAKALASALSAKTAAAGEVLRKLSEAVAVP